MNLLREFTYRAKKLLIGIYGPAQLDEQHDPLVRLDREHEREVRSEEAAEEAARGNDPT